MIEDTNVTLIMGAITTANDNITGLREDMTEWGGRVIVLEQANKSRAMTSAKMMGLLGLVFSGGFSVPWLLELIHKATQGGGGW